MESLTTFARDDVSSLSDVLFNIFLVDASFISIFISLLSASAPVGSPFVRPLKILLSCIGSVWVFVTVEDAWPNVKGGEIM